MGCQGGNTGCWIGCCCCCCCCCNTGGSRCCRLAETWYFGYQHGAHVYHSVKSSFSGFFSFFSSGPSQVLMNMCSQWPIAATAMQCLRRVYLIKEPARGLTPPPLWGDALCTRGKGGGGGGGKVRGRPFSPLFPLPPSPPPFHRSSYEADAL
jgi:hypothetical protein